MDNNTTTTTASSSHSYDLRSISTSSSGSTTEIFELEKGIHNSPTPSSLQQSVDENEALSSFSLSVSSRMSCALCPDKFARLQREEKTKSKLKIVRTLPQTEHSLNDVKAAEDDVSTLVYSFTSLSSSPNHQPTDLHSPTHSQSAIATSFTTSPAEDHITDAAIKPVVTKNVHNSSYNLRKRTLPSVPSSA